MLMNPLSADLNCMRQTLLFGGLESVEHNMKRKNGNIRFFEFGNCYDYNKENKKEDQTLGEFSEDYRLALWLCGNRVENNWAHPNEKSSVYELKAYVENILVRLGVNLKKVIFGNLTNDIYDAALSITTQSGKQLARRNPASNWEQWVSSAIRFARQWILIPKFTLPNFLGTR